MIAFAVERLMESETETLCNAAPGERSADRIAQRNGYGDRDWQTRAGTVELRIPKLSGPAPDGVGGCGIDRRGYGEKAPERSLPPRPPKRRQQPPALSGAGSPISCAPSYPSSPPSWTRPRP